MPNDVQQEGHLSRVAKGNLADQGTLQGMTVLHRGVTVQEVAVLLVWQHLFRAQRKSIEFFFLPMSDSNRFPPPLSGDSIQVDKLPSVTSDNVSGCILEPLTE